MSPSARPRLVLAAAVVVAAATAGPGLAAGPASSGSVKIWSADEEDGNVPHLSGCALRVSGSGFHTGLRTGTVTVRAQKGEHSLLLPLTPAGALAFTGLARPGTPDFDTVFTVDTAGAEHQAQGVHVRVEVEVDGVGKSKTIWVSGCTAEPGTPAPGTGPSTPDPSTPGTPDPGTPDPGTRDPGTPDPGTPDPGTPDPGTPDSGTPDPGTPVTPGTPGTPDPGTGGPAAADPGTPDPGAGGPAAAEPGGPGPSDPGPSTPDPGTAVPDTPVAPAAPDPSSPDSPDPGTPDPVGPAAPGAPGAALGSGDTDGAAEGGPDLVDQGVRVEPSALIVDQSGTPTAAEHSASASDGAPNRDPEATAESAVPTVPEEATASGALGSADLASGAQGSGGLGSGVGRAEPSGAGPGEGAAAPARTLLLPFNDTVRKAVAATPLLPRTGAGWGLTATASGLLLLAAGLAVVRRRTA